MVGKGGCVVHAALAWPGVRFVGADSSTEQLATCAANVAHAGVSGVIDLVHASATALPVVTGSIDGVVVDLPFGRRHAKPTTLAEAAIREARRVLRRGTGRMAVLTTSKKSVHDAVCDDPAWMPVSRTEVCLGGLKAWMHLLRRTQLSAERAESA